MTLINRDRALSTMESAGVDALLATSPGNVAYVTDAEFQSLSTHPVVNIFALFEAAEPDNPAVVIPSHEVDPWAEQPGQVSDVTVYGRVFRKLGRPVQSLEEDDAEIYAHAIEGETHAEAISGLRSMLQRRGLTGRTIGLDESRLPAPVWQTILDALPDTKFVPASQLFQVIRMVKTDEEVERLRRSARVTARALQAVFSAAEEGISEAELASEFRAEGSRLGAYPTAWLISIGRRTSHTHTRQTEHRAGAGDLVKADAGVVLDFYWSDLARTKVIGEPDPYQAKTYELLCSAVREATSEVKAGVRTSHIFDTAIGVVRDGGIPDYDRHHAGHGIGVEVYDPPLVSAADHQNVFGLTSEDPVLETGMVINIETPYYELGSFGLIVEDTVLVKQDGFEILAPMDYSIQLPLEGVAN